MRITYRKPTAYMKRVYNGFFMLERTAIWRAEDAHGHHIASAPTRKACERACRDAGYVPVPDSDRPAPLHGRPWPPLPSN